VPPDSSDQQQNIAAAITEVSDRMTLLVREEIELAKAEVTAKMTKLVRGIAVAAAAGIFILIAVMFALDGFAWLIYYEVPFGNAFTYFWGFFIMAGILLVFGALAGGLAYRALKSGSPPTPQMAIDEARLIRETLGSGVEGQS
jgi:uncharacterized membrane protein YgcG